MQTRSGRGFSQNEDELKSLISLFHDHDVRSYIEIGTRHGDTFFEVMKNLPIGSVGIAVDLPGGAWGRNDSAISLNEAIDELRHLGYNVGVVYGDSKRQTVKDAVVGLLSHHGIEKSVGAILIDGDHRLEGVSADWNNWGGFSNIVAFHDIAGDGVIQKGSGLPVEVPILWQEIKTGHETIEFVSPGSKMGIGVVLK